LRWENKGNDMDDDLKERLARLEERSEHIIGKVDDVRMNTGKIFDRLDKLPCGVMSEKIKGINSRIGWVWAIIIFICFSIIGTAIKERLF